MKDDSDKVPSLLTEYILKGMLLSNDPPVVTLGYVITQEGSKHPGMNGM